MVQFFLPKVTENSVVKEYIGNEAQERRDILSLSYPSSRRVVTWFNSFYQRSQKTVLLKSI